MYINHNGMASTVANNLTSHYSNLSTSTQRLSSGLRVNSAADDAAGLAIRELMRADISALQQGVRNANDGISLIQTADGALGIIDEKLIRMKELAEQAATGTYDSTQRLMIESEYQAMASEITRIANATDFNNMKLLDGSLEGTHDGSKLDSSGALKVHFGSGNDSAEDYYYIEIEEMTAAALGVGNQSGWSDVQTRGTEEIRKNLVDGIKNGDFTEAEKGQLLNQVDTAVANINTAISNAIKPENAYNYWSAETSAAGWDEGFLEEAKKQAAVQGNSTVMEDFLATGAKIEGLADAIVSAVDGVMKANGLPESGDTGATANLDASQTALLTGTELPKQLEDAINAAMDKAGISQDTRDALMDAFEDTTTGLKTVLAAATTDDAVIAALGDFKDAVDGVLDDPTVASETKTALNNNYKSLTDGDQQKLNYAFGKAAMYNLANVNTTDETTANGTYLTYGIEAGADATFGFGAKADGTGQITGADKLLANALQAGYDKIKDMDVAGYTIATQEDAQHALNAINDAIVQKDKTRAHLGALQNRLENTVSNLTIQTENLQAAESRISDVDVATEMTNFVRNQILTQSAVAMLGQANSMPQMAMQLIG